jgi:hypothetical protein
MPSIEPYHGLFRWHDGQDGNEPHLSRHESSPRTVPCPTTGHPLRVATVDANSSAICPSCESRGRGGFVSFEGDLRMAYACPQCRQFVWLEGV